MNRDEENASGITIFMLLTMPSVTDCDIASGLPIANTESPTCRRPGVAELDRHELPLAVGLQFQHRNVRERIGSHQLGFDFFIVRQDANDARGMTGHVMIRDDVPFLRNDDAAAARLVLHLAPLIILSGNNLNPHQRWLHPRDCAFNGRMG